MKDIFKEKFNLKKGEIQFVLKVAYNPDIKE